MNASQTVLITSDVLNTAEKAGPSLLKIIIFVSVLVICILFKVFQIISNINRDKIYRDYKPCFYYTTGNCGYPKGKLKNNICPIRCKYYSLADNIRTSPAFLSIDVITIILPVILALINLF